jgi:hypothetical protein
MDEGGTVSAGRLEAEEPVAGIPWSEGFDATTGFAARPASPAVSTGVSTRGEFSSSQPTAATVANETRRRERFM